MKCLIALALAAAAVLAMPIRSYAAGSFAVRNMTSVPLKFALRCRDDADDWHAFSLASNASQTYTWSHSCPSERYQMRVGTTESDGTVQWATIDARAGTRYALVRIGDFYTARNMAWMVLLHNTASLPVNVSYRCTSGGSGSGTAAMASGRIGWIWVQDCTSFVLGTRTREKDGSINELWRRVDGNSSHRIVWSADRSAYAIE